MPHSGPHFLRFGRVLMPKTVDFGSPLAPSGAPNGAQNRPSGAKMLTFSQRRCALFPTYFHTYFSERSWVPFWLILDGLRMNFDGFGYHFYLIVYKFLATILQTTKAACPDDIGRAIREQLPTTPLGAPFSQYFWRALLSKAKFWENAKSRQELTKTKS